jgi:hypothetical protein
MFQDYGDDGFFPIMVMYDGTSAASMQLANELGLTFPVLSDPELEVFDRLNPNGETPKSTFLSEGLVVEHVSVGWYPGLVEELLYPEEE